MAKNIDTGGYPFILSTETTELALTIDKVEKALHAIGPPYKILPATIYVLLSNMQTDLHYKMMLQRMHEMWIRIQDERKQHR